MRPTEYIDSDRRGRAAHDLELAAMCNPLLAEALEGLDAVPGNHADAVTRLRSRLQTRVALSRRKLIVRLAIAAALFAAIATTALLTLHRPEVPADFPAMATTTSPPKTTAKSAAETLTQAQQPPINAQPVSLSPVPPAPTSGPAEAHAQTQQPAFAQRQAALQQQPDPAVKPAVAPVPSGQKQPPINLQSIIPPPTRSAPESAPAKSFEPEHPEYWEPTEESEVTPADINDVVVVAYGTAKKETFTGVADKQRMAIQLQEEALKDLQTVHPPGAAANRRREGARTGKNVADTLPLIAANAHAGGPTLAASDTAIEDQPFITADASMPSFQGGDLHTFRKWVNERIRKPEIALENGISGRIVVSFVIDTLGRLGEIKVLQSPDRILSEEAIRVLKSSPRWEPARQGSRKVPIKYVMPIDF